MAMIALGCEVILFAFIRPYHNVDHITAISAFKLFSWVLKCCLAPVRKASMMPDEFKAQLLEK